LKLARQLARQGWDLVWGGGKASMMGQVAIGCKISRCKNNWGNSRTIKLILNLRIKRQLICMLVSDMRTRKAKIEELSDAFIALPGGIGTLEEFFEIWVGSYLKFHQKPIAICDPTGVYDPLRFGIRSPIHS